jgi:hypothetical protein
LQTTTGCLDNLCEYPNKFVSRHGGQPLPRLRHRTGRGFLSQLKRPAAPECASRTPCSAAPSPPAAAVFDFRAHFCHSAPMETHAFGFRLLANAPEGQKRFPKVQLGHG